LAKKNSRNEETHDRVIENRKARHDYHVLESVECGIALRGWEVKSVRDGKVQIVDGFVRARAEPIELTVFGINIEPYGPAGPVSANSNSKRARTLLAHKREITKMARQSEEKGFTLVPLKMYFKNGYAKVLVGLCKGKQAHDKRRAIAERENKRELDRATSRRR
jgi:SsrA-binding protein